MGPIPKPCPDYATSILYVVLQNRIYTAKLLNCNMWIKLITLTSRHSAKSDSVPRSIYWLRKLISWKPFITGYY